MNRPPTDRKTDELSSSPPAHDADQSNLSTELSSKLRSMCTVRLHTSALFTYVSRFVDILLASFFFVFEFVRDTGMLTSLYPSAVYLDTQFFLWLANSELA